MMKILGYSKKNCYFIALLCSIPLKPSVPEIQTKVIVLSERKMFQWSYGYSKQFPEAKPWLLTREATLQHDMAREIRLHFLLVEGLNF